MNKLYSVHDHWTDIDKKNDVDIESIDGVITGIKVNGEDYGGGESDFSTANMTLEGAGTPPAINIGIVFINPTFDDLEGNPIETGIASGTYVIPLYKGRAVAFIDPSNNYTITGNATVDEEGTITITGDFTVTAPGITIS